MIKIRELFKFLVLVLFLICNTQVIAFAAMNEGNLLVVDFDDSLVEVSSAGTVLNTYASGLLPGAISATFSHSGNPYVVQTGAFVPGWGMLSKLDRNGNILSTYSPGFSFRNPRGLEFNSNGELYVVATNYTIFRFDDNLNPLGSFNGPTSSFYEDLTFDINNNLYVTDSNNDQILIFDQYNTFINSFSHSSLSFPTGLVFDSFGNLYVTNGSNNSVTVFDSNQLFITNFTHSDFSFPQGVGLDAQNNIYIAGNSSGKVIKFDSSYSPLGSFSGFTTPVDVVSIPSVIPEPVSLDIKPQFCTNPLNINNQGVLPVAILGTENFDVSTIDLASIQLAGVVPIRSGVEDVSTPLVDMIDECECTTEGPDGYTDLTLKFDAQEIVAALGEVSDGEELILTLTGELLDGTSIEGEDCIIIHFKGKNK